VRRGLDDIARRDRSRSRWTLILNRDEQGFVNAARRLTAGGSIHHIGSVSFRSPAVRWRSERESALHAP